ncbi:MAG: hypothetical protein JWO36_2389 [Myxococcales bacterium]|nr:hypothetical protein [Myxococcales bacterium]
MLALAGCTHVAVYAQPPAIARHRAELAAGGYARIDVEQGGTVTVAADDLVNITIPGNERSHLWGLVKTGTPDEVMQVTLGSFVSGCDGDGVGEACLAARASGPIRVGMRREIDPAKLGIGLFGLLATVVGSVCLATCSNRTGWSAVGTAIGAGVMIYPLTTVY